MPTSIDYTVCDYKTHQAAFRLDWCSNDQIKDQKLRLNTQKSLAVSDIPEEKESVLIFCGLQLWRDL